MPDKVLDHAVSSKQAGLAFFEQAMALLENLRRTQADIIQKAAELCAERISRGGLVFLFGNLRRSIWFAPFATPAAIS